MSSQKTKEILEQMKAAKIKPNIRTINTVLRGYIRIGDITSAKELFEITTFLIFQLESNARIET